MPKKPYSKRTDLEKVESNWTKTLGLFSRKEYSLSIVRAAVTAELAINYAIRYELHDNHGVPSTFIDKQLMDANGIANKLDRLYIPILIGTEHEKQTKEIAKSIKTLNKQRNDIAHRGEFRKKETAQQFVELAEKEINVLLKRYNSEVTLTTFIPSKTHSITIPSMNGFITIPMHPEEDEK